MHTLRMLGGIGLVDAEGRNVEALLRQPKHMALLAYLALPRPGVWHRRDSVLGIFWPESEQSRARSTLRSALYTLRGHLPGGVVASRGDDELSLDPASITTDVAIMSEDLSKERFAAVVAAYHGDLLPGFYLTDSDAFEKWLDQERRRIRRLVRQAAGRLADTLERSGDLAGAVGAARRAAELDPDDEAAARRWITLLDRAGDRAQAFAVYEQFRNHLAEAFGVRPSAETVALLDAVRTRRGLAATPIESHEPLVAGPREQDPPTLAPAGERGTTRVYEAQRSAHRRRWLWLLAPAGVAVALFGWRALRQTPAAAAPVSPRVLVVLPMRNETQEPGTDYIASGIAAGIARRLEGMGGLTIRSGARSNWSDAARADLHAIGREFGATILLDSRMTRIGDSLQVEVSVLDAATLEERTVTPRRFGTGGILDAESSIAAEVAGILFRTPIPVPSRTRAHAIDSASYRLTLQGLHQLNTNLMPVARGAGSTPYEAGELFARAVIIDPLNATAWAGLSSVWGSMAATDNVPFDEGYERSTAAALRAIAIDSMQGKAWANLAIMRAMKDRSLAAGMVYLARAEAAEPSDAGIFSIRNAMLLNAHRWDEARDAARMARRLDPLTSNYVDREAFTELCADRAELALRLYRSELEMNPADRLIRVGLTRALARLGRYDEAIASWREEALIAGDTSLASALEHAKGASDYWGLRHREGRKRVAALARQSGRVSLVRLMQARLAAGDAAGGFEALELAASTGTRALYRLPCMTDADEYVHTPRFVRAVTMVGHLRPQ